MPEHNNIELQRLEIEKRLRERECRLREKEHGDNTELRRKELVIQEKEIENKGRELELLAKKEKEVKWTSPLFIGIAAAVVGLLGNAIVASINGAYEHRRALLKSQSDMLLATLKSEDVEKVKQNLLLLAKTRLIDDKEKQDAIVDYVVGLSPGEGPGLDTKVVTPKSNINEVNTSSGIISSWSRLRRDRLFRSQVMAGKTKILTIGDSWLSYPILIDDIGDYLGRRFAVKSLGDVSMGIERAVSVASETDHEGGYEVVIISVGLLDLWGKEVLDQVLLKNEGQTTSDRFISRKYNDIITRVIDGIRKVIEGVKARNAQATIFLHGYDYFWPMQNGEFLGSIFERKLIMDVTMQKEIVRALVDRFNEQLQDVAEGADGVKFVDLRGTLDSPASWYDELHPSSDGCRWLANVLIREIGRVVQATDVRDR